MKSFSLFKTLLFILLVIVLTLFTIVDEIIKGTFSLITKVRLNYQLMMYIKQMPK